jgi:FKBP-type peptidyl-prolyl cis-trans isomerase (trigger factor)
MNNNLEHLEDGSIAINIIIPWTKVANMYDEVLSDFVNNAELPGFRKGKAPRDMVEKSLDKGKVYEEVLKRVIPQAYTDAVKTNDLHPIVVPKVEIKEAEEKKDWLIRAITSEKPKITIGDYKTKITDLKNAKSKKIWLPGEDPKAQKEEVHKITVDEVLNALYESITIKLPKLLIENEVNRMLSDLIDQTKKLGLTVEQYLASTHKTAESIKKDYEDESSKTITLEFALEEIGDKEGILISDDDIEKALATIKSEDEKKALAKEKYYLATILRRQKTLEYLASV